MAWEVVPNLNEMRDEFDSRFPNRDKRSDGSIGDTSHQASSSSHNPDKTGNPEWRDYDSKDEVRARDVDADLNDPDGVKMEDVVQNIVKLCREGKLWWVRYLIFNKRIWHKNNNYKTQEYNGSNKHTNHLHVNSDYTQKADEIRGTDWGIRNFKKKSSSTPKKSVNEIAKEVIRGDWGNGVDRKNALSRAGYNYNDVQNEVNKILNTPKKPKFEILIEDGKLGPKTISRWQQEMGTTVDGVISIPNSELVRAVQRFLRDRVDHRLAVDGHGIVQNNRPYKTVGALQRYLKSPVDNVMTYPVSNVVKALQRRLNEGWF